MSRLDWSRIILIVLTLSLIYTYDEVFPNLLKIFSTFFTLSLILYLKKQQLRDIIDKLFKGKFLYIVISFLVVINICTYFSDMDNDGLVIAGELLAHTSINSEDEDHDVLKDGLEFKHSNQSYFNPTQWDTNGNHISDFCDLIYIQRKTFDKSLNELSKTNIESAILDSCNKTLEQNHDFSLCNNSDPKERILLNTSCKDIVYNKIADLRKSNFTYYEQ